MQEFPNDEKTFDMNDQFMLGDALLVKPITKPAEKSISVYLPTASVN